MARDGIVTVAANIWTQLTNSDADAVRVQNGTGITVKLQATNGATAPTGTPGTVDLLSGMTLAADLTLAELWPGVTGANRLWALSSETLPLSVSHA